MNQPYFHRLGSIGDDYGEREQVRVGAADHTRRIINLLARTDAGAPALAEVAELLERAADLLEREPRRTRPRRDDHSGATEGLDFVDVSPVAGPMNPLAPPLVPEVAGRVVRARAVYGPAFEGPPGHVHGGHIAAGFDEVLGFVQGMSGIWGMTGRLEVKYRSPTPLGTEVVYEARLESVSGRKILCSATLHHGERLCAESSALFVAASPELWDRLAAQWSSESTEA